MTMVMEVLTNEQFEELGALLKGTQDGLEEGLAELGINVRASFLSKIENQLADKEEIERCAICGTWTFSEALTQDENGELLCSSCLRSYTDDEEEW